MKKLCKRCNAKMNSSTLESADDHGFHEHLECKENEKHPIYCITEKIWIGK